MHTNMKPVYNFLCCLCLTFMRYFYFVYFSLNAVIWFYGLSSHDKDGDEDDAVVDDNDATLGDNYMSIDDCQHQPV